MTEQEFKSFLVQANEVKADVEQKVSQAKALIAQAKERIESAIKKEQEADRKVKEAEAMNKRAKYAQLRLKKVVDELNIDVQLKQLILGEGEAASA